MSGYDYPLALAAEDFVPVALTVTGVALLAALPGVDPRRVRIAAGLLATGGFAKAGWKVVVALDGPDLCFLYHALFPFLAAGFLLLAHELLRRPPLGVHAGLLAVAGAASLAVGDSWPVMILAIAAVSVAAVALARRGQPLLFLLWLAGQYVLGPLAARPDQSVALQWVEQGCNTLTQAVLVLAAWRLTGSARQEVSA
ncbi:hypothetical protein [Actinocorallia longicatena]|uniref:Lysoplasmalogenase n=1 Tax=Actinocorallia longicatena TaxID=111803 RepID=A0ABP6Q3Y7_9ACTN